MKIYVDADACPVVAIVEQIAKEYEIPVTLLCDTNHVLYSDYSEVVTVGAGADAVDFKLVSLCHKGERGNTGLWCRSDDSWKGSIWNPSEWQMVYE